MIKTFLAKLALYSLGTVLLFFLTNGAIHAAHFRARTGNADPRAVYVLGDSRADFGLDLGTLEARLGRPVHSFATPGASAYAYLALAEAVPAGATVLVSPSGAGLVLSREDATYKAGLQPRALVSVVELGYDVWYLERIFLENRYPLGTKHRRRVIDRLTVDQAPPAKLDRFLPFYRVPARHPDYDRNLAMLDRALRLLVEKGCEVLVVVLPTMPEFAALEAASPYGRFADALPVLRGEPRIRALVDLELPQLPGKNIWYDADHLNMRGRKLATNLVLRRAFGVAVPESEDLVEDWPAVPEIPAANLEGPG